MPKTGGVVAAKVEASQSPAWLEEMIDLGRFQEVSFGRGKITLEFVIKTRLDPTRGIVACRAHRRIPKAGGKEERNGRQRKEKTISHETSILVGLTILCVLILCADLATARGSFLLDGWKVWNNATVSTDSRVVTDGVPVRIRLPSRQILWIADASAVKFDGRRISVEKGCAQLDKSGDYSLAGKARSGLMAGSSEAEVARAVLIPQRYKTLLELRPMSQRP
jgi:hypothetical protein